jgi:hypothetical protein
MGSYRSKNIYYKYIQIYCVMKNFVSIKFVNNLIIKVFNLIAVSLENYFHCSMNLDLKTTQILTVTSKNAHNR